ncbi:MAG: flippase-like domain-containing protein, partial [Acidobacteria bacterium]|nr:flippase-like domain-containing protein [Acidobacteriota bacterium]
AVCLFVRFVRWQFLLRRAGIPVPARASLSLYLASLAGVATPGHAGELIRGAFLRRQFGVPLLTTALLLAVERLLDAAALGLLGAVTASHTGIALALAGFSALSWIAAAAVCRVTPGAEALRQAGNLARALGISLVAWIPTALLVPLAARGLDFSVSPATGLHVFATSTLAGALTLLPAGVGATGTLAIYQLQGAGAPLSDAVAAVSFVRLATVGFSVAIGLAFLARQWRGSRRPGVQAAQHFDEIAAHYAEQFSGHVWDHLLDRKIGLLVQALPASASTGIGLDLGCGLGLHCVAMANRRYRVLGLDISLNLARRARENGATVTAGDALAIPLRESSVDFVYSIGALHHLPGKAAQQAALREVTRILRPGGRLIVHETNPRNPVFRFYMGYLFPILKSIDDGTESWIEPEHWPALEGLRLTGIHYFTFLPDFIPQSLMPPFRALERLAERSFLHRYSVHYMATMEKPA